MAISYDGLAKSLNLRKDEKLLRILSVGARIIADEGFERATIRKVAAAVGVSVSSLYYYFKNKEDLLYQIQYHTFRTLLDSLEERLKGVASSEEQLQILIRNHLSHYLRHMPELKVCSHELWTLKGEKYKKVEALRRENFKVALQIVKGLQPLRPGIDPRLATLYLYGMLNWIYTWYDPKEGEGERRLANQMTNLFLNGVRA
ncbi:MAG: TetR/AcrR family transcriptional regulator [Planctomycetota bacterium]|jgi:AcrR family transcriptional regulator